MREAYEVQPKFKQLLCEKLLNTIYDRSALLQIQSIDIRIPTKLFMAQKSEQDLKNVSDATSGIIKDYS